MKALLKKELRLCLHPTAPMMILLSALTLIPNYPYGVAYFYLTLSVFFICLTGRENHDIVFSLTLPIGKRDVVRGRFALVMLLEVCQLVCMVGFILLHRALSPLPNAAGMDANLALIAEGFLYYSVFHLIFFPTYYKNVSKVGTAFVLSSAVIFLLVVADVVSTYAIPFFRDVLDTPDPDHMGAKLGFLAASFCVYLISAFVSLRLSQKRFQRLDIR